MEVWQGFLSCHSTRTVTKVGICPITYVEILAWLEINNIEQRVRQEYAHIIRKLDNVFMERIKEDANT